MDRGSLANISPREWQAGGDSSFWHRRLTETGCRFKLGTVFRTATGSTTWLCVGILTPNVRKCLSLWEFCSGLDAHTQVDKREAEG